MKNNVFKLLLWLFVGLMVFIGFVGIVSLGAWVVSLLLNVVLSQVGLGTINVYGVLCLVCASFLIYKYIKW